MKFDDITTGPLNSMAGLIDLAHTGVIDRTVPTIFIHTGGLPILFAFGEELGHLAQCEKR